jgi:hypothetical protein
MKVLLISYDLKRPPLEYTKLYDIIKESKKWWHYLDSTWLVWTNETPSSLFGKMEKLVDKNDRLLIIEVKKNYYGWLQKEAWDWMDTITWEEGTYQSALRPTT